VATLAEAARRAGVGRFLQVGTDEEYGTISDGSFAEDDRLEPSSPYSAGKAGGSLVALAYAATHKLDVVVTRCTNNYGPYQFPEKVIPLFVTNLMDGHKVPLYGSGATFATAVRARPLRAIDPTGGRPDRGHLQHRRRQREAT
jgi:dTDP-glucose 4,6-dehydratase